MTKNKKPAFTGSMLGLKDMIVQLSQCKDTHFEGCMQIISKVFNHTEISKSPNRVKYIGLPQEKKETQLKRVEECFSESPKTMLQVAIETGILRANVCRHVATLRKSGRIQVHHYGMDAKTRCQAAFLTTDTTLFKSPTYNQLNLFEQT